MMVWIAVGLDIVWGVSVIFVKKTVAIHLKLNIINIQQHEQERFKKFECQNLCKKTKVTSYLILYDFYHDLTE